MDKFQNFSLDGVFLFGKFSYENARQIAVKCEFFTTDSDEDELVDSDPKSCYNCLFRRWSKESFECLKLR
ncbi:molybdopterin biosynthesis protein MoeB [Campylobacter sp. RM16187]|uniref:molybdopterin biosynthesis protein MoeB n=1 Tax=Campylobacter sp. RM16187 TaxID=1660063 RepID=UPI0021B6CBBF|nr:molybdopterin biosynthesis protein MoeB [Campylobacter sp. RM16187]QKG28451.1 hypothetical protein CDOMF_0153 [Campylobacter sp. RM16187]